ncbi:hypothetical protein [Bowmanella dokdonensis]|uniref:Uncharacterized protein n=1 Tax=Bowmanella dokdonensis TaxID=751969 RepID=A0A939DJL9_9ALTE|nr:hypothetical protein [Bowmanella dokdonensis]MBN7823852.1 hypothetical protein [Bowmanella dokdonensis]
MTDQKDPFASLYRHRKHRTNAPRQSRDYILAKAEDRKAGARLQFNVWNWTLGLSLCAAVLLLFRFVGDYRYQMQRPTIEAQTVQLHRLNQEQNSLLASISQMKQQTRIELADNYARYMDNRELLSTHHSNYARLMNTEDGWQIETCEQQLLVLTRELVDQMQQRKLFEQDLKRGDQIEIAFDQSGRILAIKGRHTGQSC